MVQIQIELDNEENKIIEIYKAIKNYETKERTIKQIIREFKPKIPKFK